MVCDLSQTTKAFNTQSIINALNTINVLSPISATNGQTKMQRQEMQPQVIQLEAIVQ